MSIKIEIETNFLYQFERFARGYWECPSWDCSVQAVILSSFPKSGNTWMRFVVSNVASIVDAAEDVNFWTIDKYAPVIRGNRALSGMKKVSGLPVFLKSHSAYVSGFARYKSVLIIRDPFKAIPSYRNFLSKARGRNIGSIDKFCRHWRYGFNAWAQHAALWDEHATVIVKYEDLLADPLREVARVYSILGCDVPGQTLEKALELSSRENMRKIQETNGDPHNYNAFKFVNDINENNGIRDYFNDEQLHKEFHFFCKMALKFGYMDKSLHSDLRDDSGVLR